MNKIKILSAKNLKNRTFSHELNSVNIIVGGNATGKTAELIAARLVLLGHDPKLGRTSGGIFAACGCAGGGATSLDVSATLTDGTAIARNWTMRKGKISYTGPEEAAIPGILLDPSTYFALTGPARLNYVLSQCDLAELGLGCEPLLIKINEVEATGQTALLALAEIKAKVFELETARGSGSVYDWITAVVEAITTMGKAAKDQVDRHTETLAGLVDNKSAENDMSAIQSVQPEITAARAEHTAAVTAEVNAMNAFTQAERAVQEAKDAARKLVNEDTINVTISRHQAEIDAAKQVTEPGPQPVPAVMTSRPSDELERKAYNDAQNAANRTAEHMRATAQTANRIVEEIERAKSQTCCPTCGHDITTTQAELVKKMEALSRLAEAEDKAAGEAHTNARANEATAFNALEIVVNDISRWDIDKVQLDAQNHAAYLKWKHHADLYNEAQKTINTATSKIHLLKMGIEGNAIARAASANLPVLEAASQRAGESYTSAKTALAPINERIRELESKQRQFVARTQTARLADQSREALKTATARHAVFKAAFKVVAGEKERASTAAFGSILKHARLFTDGLIKAPLEYRDGEIGMCVTGNWISYKVFSGFEESVAFMALGVALTQNEQCAVRLVMADEMGRLDSQNKGRFTNRLRELIKQGIIDQALLADVTAIGYPTGDDVSVFSVE